MAAATEEAAPTASTSTPKGTGNDLAAVPKHSAENMAKRRKRNPQESAQLDDRACHIHIEDPARDDFLAAVCHILSRMSGASQGHLNQIADVMLLSVCASSSGDIVAFGVEPDKAHKCIGCRLRHV